MSFSWTSTKAAPLLSRMEGDSAHESTALPRPWYRLKFRMFVVALPRPQRAASCPTHHEQLHGAGMGRPSPPDLRGHLAGGDVVAGQQVKIHAARGIFEDAGPVVHLLRPAQPANV